MFAQYEEMIEKELEQILRPKACEYSSLLDAVLYSMKAGGKRIRPKIMMEFTRICGEAPQKALKFACALEMIHTYSLIHDDLPCMDDDDLRRGRPSCHIVFGEATALLAGDALLTDAFGTALSSDIAPERMVKAAKMLSDCAGSKGMAAGQAIDLKYENQAASLPTIKQMYLLKTGALLSAAAGIGCIIGGADDKKVNAAVKFAENLGLAFQIRDDILDIKGNEKDLGKPVGSDAQHAKSTYVSVVGLEQAEDDVEKLTVKAMEALACFGDRADELKKFAVTLSTRIK